VTNQDKTLIRDATIVSMDPKVGDLPSGDILIVGDRIAEIAPSIHADDCAVVDARGMIASPGFVDTHRHVWQTQLKGVAADWSLFDYACLMRTMYSVCYGPEDAYVGNYVGALDAIYAGITSMMDHSHLQSSEEHSDGLVQGLLDSGIRGIMCYSVYRNPKYTPGDALDSSQILGDIAGTLDDFHRANASRIREKFFPTKDSVLQFGIASSEWVNFDDPDSVIAELDWARSLEPSRVSIHIGVGVNDDVKHLTTLYKHGRLGNDLVFVHGNHLRDEQITMLRDYGGWTSTTPETELQMGMGYPVLERVYNSGRMPSLGIDLASNFAGDMFAQMRLMLQTMRFRDFENAKDGLPVTSRFPARKMLEFATLGGAMAMGTDGYTGSLAPGKKADLLLTRMDSVNMSPVLDPVAALVFYADASDIDSVWINGVARKRHGLLTGVDWPAVRTRLLTSRDRIYDSFNKISEDQIRNVWAPLWGIQQVATHK